jgi:hypothetical protein
MPMRLTVTASVRVEADPERVWEAAVDWSRQREWMWATRTDGGRGVGAIVTGRTGVGRLGFTDPMVITGWDPPRRCVVTHTGKIVRGQGEFEVLPDGARSEFVWTERIDLPWPSRLPRVLGRLASGAVGSVTRLGLGWSLYQFARMLGS